ncbi:MAG TPA: ribosome maturation factor RimM [Candidatus Limnocylindrales bacterium]|jgi:16S rRNA processing protein RimM|nr:ribosome maturation factor RimM [Candidatus Limnocylindrales bacterium]
MQCVTVARILRPHGRRGEVACEILTDFPERLKNLHAAMLWDARPASPAEARPVKIRSCWISRSRGGQAIFHFEGVESISDAEELVGLDVQIPLAERTALPEGNYFVTDLIGCEVFEKGGAMIGRVRDVQFTGEGVAGTPILVLDSPRGELLIPLAQEICVRVDVEARRIEVALPEGLLELNRE